MFDMTPRHPRGASEDVGGIDATTVAALTQLIADARAGKTAPVRAYLRANC